MKKLLLIAFTFFVLETIAQPTFTSTDMIKLPGETYSEYNMDTTGISEGVSGPNQNWSFNIITIGNASVSNIIAASSAPINTYFPTADMVITTGNVPTGPGTYSFYEQSTSQSLSIGDVNFVPPNTYDTAKYLDPLVYEKYPFTYLTAFSDSAIQLIAAPPGFPLSGSITILENVVYDAYGTLTINGQVFSNVLRRVDNDTIVIDFGVISATSLLKAYSWYQLGNKEPLLVITYSDDGSNNLVKSATINGSIVSGLNYNFKNTALNIYPNPANSELKISNAFNGNVFYEIKDLSGKTIASDQLNTISKTIDIRALSEGMYILELKSNDKILTKKFVKRS
jgi:Secretion system C-terminal sorting domain